MDSAWPISSAEGRTLGMIALTKAFVMLVLREVIV
jgi:hypothetical protein